MFEKSSNYLSDMRSDTEYGMWQGIWQGKAEWYRIYDCIRRRDAAGNTTTDSGIGERIIPETYADKDYLYIIVGYGAQPTSSYSIEVEELYESSNAIYVTTMLKGPSKTEKVLEVETYPVITIKIPYEEKPVVFQ